ncbi:hypothetical protein HYL62_003706 [Salmonella enterica]|nr:hypothetical protein [Salmonella enterica]EGT8618466.1 hypothetical protein [Salmonella enterica]
MYLKPEEDENLRGQEVRLERRERTLRQQRPAGRATQWRVILYHRPNSETLLNEQGFLHLKPEEDENLRGQEVRLERRERTLRQQRPAGRVTQWRVILSWPAYALLTYTTAFAAVCVNRFLRYRLPYLAFFAVRFNVHGINRSYIRHIFKIFALTA